MSYVDTYWIRITGNGRAHVLPIGMFWVGESWWLGLCLAARLG